MKNIYILGASGSIGTQTLDVIRENADKFILKACSFGFNIEKAIKIIEEFNPKCVSFIEEESAKIIKEKFPNIEVYYGDEGLIKVATFEKDISGVLVTAVVGSVGLLPTIEAIKIKRTIALANKETLVTAGHIVTKLARENNVKILPVDSEHSAIYQCLNGEKKSAIKRLIITASGGSFRDKSREELQNVTLEDALNHPNWNMGSKITIDSATMMNKGFEVIEAKWLFDIDFDDIDTVLHRQSVVHSLVEFNDRSIIAHMGTADMRIPIMYAISNESRLNYNSESLDLVKLSKMTFEELSLERFPMLKYAYDAGRRGGNAPTVLNAANEAAVALFLAKKIKFLEIEQIVKEELQNISFIEEPTLEEILKCDKLIKENIHNKYC